MYEYFKGNIEYISDDYLVIENNGIGYKINTSKNTLNKLVNEDKNVMIFTYLNVREDDLSLYGFLTKEEIDIFKLLLTVSKIGPKVGLGIMSTISPSELALSISSEDVKALSKAPGVGSKTAKRIILELKDKFKNNISSVKHQIEDKNNDVDEAITGLLALGYTNSEVESVLKSIDLSHYKTEDIIKYALKELSK